MKYRACTEKRICENCGREITLANYQKHYKACTNPNSFSNKHNLYTKQIIHLDHVDLFCKHCHKEFQNKNALIQHEIRCRQNPNRLQLEIPENLKKCHGQNRGKITITNGVNNKLISPNEEIPKGWHKGSCVKGKTHIGHKHTPEMKKYIGQK